jgi:UDP-glucose 4-epimerase
MAVMSVSWARSFALAAANRTAIVTGGAGFIGSHLVDALLGAGRRVVVVDDLSNGRAEAVASEASFEVLDISDKARVDRLVDDVRPSAIFHLAAQASVTRSVADPVRDCVVNVEGTLNVVEAATRHAVPVVFASTGGALYGDDAPMPTPEDTPPAPLSPYGASKLAAEAYVRTYGRAQGLPHTVARLANVYGPRQSPHGEAGVVAIFAHRLWQGERPTVYGFGRPTRDYVHVHDVVRAMLAAEGTPGVFNVSTGRETDVLTVLGELQKAACTSVEPKLEPLRAGELQRSCMDPDRARRELGWTSTIELSEGLRSTYAALTGDFESTSG